MPEIEYQTRVITEHEGDTEVATIVIPEEAIASCGWNANTERFVTIDEANKRIVLE